MNTYAIMLNKVPNHELSQELINRHIAHLRHLHRSGVLILCGPFTDHPSGMVVVKAPTKEAATEVAESDPFVKEGARTYEIRTWLLANEENNYLG
ncbi:YciI family protein [Bdellovibrio bacteriovorus]|uniref:YciI family protein n=1 Tax=Bdellovibrio TaxID=958 RepID=UPI0035A8D615